MASQETSDGKWKRRASYQARVAKPARLLENQSVSNSRDTIVKVQYPENRLPKDQPFSTGIDIDDESIEDSDSENDRRYSSSSEDESEFDDNKAQDIFDDWMISLSTIQRKTLSVLLVHALRVRQEMNIGDAAQETASITGFNKKTVRMYHKENKGKFKEIKQGKYKRHCLMSDENLRLDAAMYVREHAYQKGSANLASKSFCQWVSASLLPSHNMTPQMPRNISVRTTTRRLHLLGFRPQVHKKGIYVDRQT